MWSGRCKTAAREGASQDGPLTQTPSLEGKTGAGNLLVFQPGTAQEPGGKGSGQGHEVLIARALGDRQRSLNVQMVGCQRRLWDS